MYDELDIHFAAEQLALAAARINLLVEELNRHIVSGHPLRTHEIQHRAQTVRLSLDDIDSMVESLWVGNYDTLPLALSEYADATGD